MHKHIRTQNFYNEKSSVKNDCVRKLILTHKKIQEWKIVSYEKKVGRKTLSYFVYTLFDKYMCRETDISKYVSCVPGLGYI